MPSVTAVSIMMRKVEPFICVRDTTILLQADLFQGILMQAESVRLLV